MTQAFEPSFVGRAEERALLGRVIDRTSDGRGGLVLVVGEPGIGKTRLVAAELADHELPVVWARAREGAGAPPLWLWEQVTRAATVLGWARPPTGAAASPAAGTGQDRFARFDELSSRLVALARRRPFVIALDDLQWADADSLALLEFLVPDLADVPLAVVATARVGELDVVPRAEVVIELSGLGGAELGELLTDLTGIVPTDDLLGAVERATSGSPFFVAEVARLLGSSGHAADPVHWRGVLPEGVRAVLTRRFARLPQESHHVLAAAAVLGDEIDVTVLAAVIDQDRPDVMAQLAPAVDSGLLRDLGDGRFAFAHALVHEAARHLASRGQSTRLHARAATVLEAWRGARAAPAIAAHLAAAGDAAGAACWAERAGEEAARRAMYAEAATWFGRALDGTDGPAPGLRVRYADALSRIGRTDEAGDEYARAAREARAIDDTDALARAALGTGTLGGGFEVRLLDEAQLALLQEALERVPPGDSVARSVLLARLSVASTLRAGQGERQRLADEALAMARRLGDPAATAAALGAWCDAHAGPADAQARVEATAEMLAAARRSGDPELELLARRLRIVGLMELAEVTLASREIDAFVRLADALRQPQFCWYARLIEGMRAFLRGDLDEAERLGTAASALGRAARSANAEMLVDAAFLPVLARERGDASFIRALDEINREHPEAARGLDVVPLFAVGYGATPEAVRRCLATLDPFTMIDPNDGLFVQGLTLTGDAAAFVGDEAMMARLLPALEPYADRLVLDGTAAVCYGPVSTTLARMAAARGDVVGAQRYYERALDLLHRIRAPLLIATVERERAALQAGPAPNTVASVFRREGDVWLVAHQGEQRRLRHTKGLGDLAVLLARPGTEVHVFDLVAVGEGRTAGDGVTSASTGPVLDDRARAQYERRIRELTEDIEEAEHHHDLGRAARLDDERAVLLAQLAAALGLSGRARQAGSDVERARKAVGMRIRDAISRIEAELPPLGRHLRHAVRTGTYCCYQPEHPIEWQR